MAHILLNPSERPDMTNPGFRKQQSRLIRRNVATNSIVRASYFKNESRAASRYLTVRNEAERLSLRQGSGMTKGMFVAVCSQQYAESHP